MDEIEHRLLAGAGVIGRSANRDLSGRLDSALRRGRLVAMHPGVYCRPEAAANLETRILAAAVWSGPDAVLTRWAAARITFAPTIRVPIITVALPTTVRRAAPGIAFERRRIPPELIQRGPVTVTRANLTAVDLAETRDGGAVIDEALRTRAATLGELWQAFELTPNRPGNRMRRTLLHESRHRPWSEPEREMHRLLDRAGIIGWVTNAQILTYFVDVLFEAAMLVLEIDGWEVHGSRAAFERDRKRRDEIEVAGYRVLNFTWRQIVDEPEWVIDCVLRALADDRCSRVLAQRRNSRSA